MSIPDAHQTVGRPMEVLMVEDSLTAAKLTMGALTKGQIPHHLTWMKTGEDALEFVQRAGRFANAPRPDLILLDLGLRGSVAKKFWRTSRMIPTCAVFPSW